MIDVVSQSRSPVARATASVVVPLVYVYWNRWGSSTWKSRFCQPETAQSPAAGTHLLLGWPQHIVEGVIVSLPSEYDAPEMNSTLLFLAILLSCSAASVFLDFFI